MAKRSDGKAAVPATVRKALIAGAQTGAVDSEKLLSAILDVWGGERELVTDLRAEFKAATPGSIARQRILEMINRLIMHCTERNLTRVKKPEDMTMEELEATFAVYHQRLTHARTQEEADASPA